jgi:AhpD family alkylhydroperoxidase
MPFHGGIPTTAIKEPDMYDMNNRRKVADLEKGAPNAWTNFKAFEKATIADGAIPKKYKELIALGVALTTQCPYSLELHRHAAIQAGATAEELAETVMVAALMRAGAAVMHGTHLMPQS